MGPDRVRYGALGCDHGVYAPARLKLEVVDGGHVQRVGHGDADRAATQLEREHSVCSSELRSDGFEGARVSDEGPVDVCQAELEG